MPTIENAGATVHFERSGHGLPVLLLAGMASDSASWNPIIPALSQQADVIRLDNRCAGQTRPMPIEISRSLMVDDVIALLDALNIEKVTLIGHSLGALVAWAVAASAPERINAVVAASAPFTVDPTRVDLFQTLARLRTPANEADWFRMLFQFLFSAKFFADKNQIDSAVDAAMLYPFKQSNDAFTQQCAALPSFLEPISLPSRWPFEALALTGANDKLFTPADLRRCYADHPQVTLAVIDDAAHSVHWENAGGFIDAVSAFLANCRQHE